jgi:hypothetical protein
METIWRSRKVSSLHLLFLVHSVWFSYRNAFTVNPTKASGRRQPLPAIRLNFA